VDKLESHDLEVGYSNVDNSNKQLLL